MKIKNIDERDVAELLQKFDGQVDRDILNTVKMEIYGNEEIYRLSGGRILLKLHDGNGVMYNSLEDLQNLFLIDPLALIPKIDENFLVQVPDCINQLAIELKLELSISDKIDDLAKLDSAIRANGGIMSVSVEEHLLPLVAYCGQALLNETGGVWEVVRENGGEPQLFIKGSNGNRYDIYNTVLKEMADASDDFSFRVVVSDYINPFNFLKTVGGRDR